MTPLGGSPSDWREHGFTAKLRKHVEEQLRHADMSLESACQKTTDPRVAQAHSRRNEIAAFLIQLGKVNSDGSTDDGDD